MDTQIVHVLCCARNSIYKTLPGTDCWDIDRDVRSFDGASPVVAHPPCRSWSAFCAHQAKPPLGEKELGPLCVDILTRNGGVLEHPAYSRLFEHCGLPRPGEERDGMWTVQVQQSWWGFNQTKKTWLCFFGIPKDRIVFPEPVPHDPTGDRRRWQMMSKHQRAATPPPLAAWLVNAATQFKKS